MTGFLPGQTPFESFTFPFFDFSGAVDHQIVADGFMAAPDADPDKGKRGLYIHIPFCDTICTFCPFVKSTGSDDRVEAYLAALHNEIQHVARTERARSWRIDAVYIGGGTPSVMTDDQAVRLLAAIHENFQLQPNAEITFEVEAKSARPSLLKAIQAKGTSRISFGIQTLDPRLREIVNLTATQDQIQKTLDIGGALFADTNADMIVGFPGQSFDDALDDLALAASLGATSISLYPMDYTPVQPKLLDRMRRGDLPRPADAAERWNMFHQGRALLLQTYEEQNMYCFGQPGLDPCQYMFSILYGTYHDRYIGLGCSAYTSLPGGLFHNAMKEKDYVQAWHNGTGSIQRCSPGHAYEKELVYFGKRKHANLANAYALGLQSFVDPRVEALTKDGLITQDGDVIRLTAKGERAYHLIMVGFMRDDQRRLYDSACDRLCDELGLLPDGSLGDQETTARGMGTAIALGEGR